MRVADDLAHAGQSGDFFRRALRVASGDQNASAGLSMNAADGGAGVWSAAAVTVQVLRNNDSLPAAGSPARSRSALPQLALDWQPRPPAWPAAEFAT
jgi:hypothetical protein